MHQPPIDHALNLTAQAMLLYGSWALTVVFFAITLRMGTREKTPFYFLLALSVLVGAFVEPIYDTAMMLYFYSTDGMITHFTAFGIPQPLWTHSGYVVLYAAPAIFMTRAAWRGTLTRTRLYQFAGVELAMSCAFEMIGINLGAYEYWGPHTFRILNYPLVIGVLETAQVMVFAVLAAQLRTRITHPTGLLGLLVLFPCTFLGVNFGVGAPTIIAIHLASPSMALTVAGTLVSIALAVLVIRAAAALIPAGAAGSAPLAATSPESLEEITG
jgi:hypothetical protein